MAQAYGIGGFVNVPPGPISGNGAPPTNFKGSLGQMFFDQSQNPPVLYIFNGSTWDEGGNPVATVTERGLVELATYSELSTGTADQPYDVAFANDVYTYVNSVMTSGAPVATETTAGIGELATDAEAVAGTASTGLLALFVTPSNLTPVFASPPAIGGTLAAAGAFTGLTADGTGVVTLASSADATISTATGSFVVSAGESATDAVKIESTAGGVQILASGAAAGEDIAITATGSSIRLSSTESATDSINIESTAGGIKILASGAAAGEDIVLTATGSSIRLTSTESATDSINIESTLGGVNILASGASAGEDINITATGSSVNINSTENAALSINLHANGGTSETIVARADQGTGDASVQLLSDVGGITLTGGKAAATAINFVTSDAAGGITMSVGTGGIIPTTSGKFTLISTDNAAQSIELHANGGASETIRIRADQGTAATSLDLLSDVGGITLNAGLSTGNAITMNASGVAGGFNIDAGTGGFIVDTTGNVSLDSATASNFTVTGVADLTLNSVGGSVVITGTEAVADAVQINGNTGAGGIDINAGTGGITVDSGGLMSLDAAGVVNLTTTGAFDITVNSTAGSIILTGDEAAVDAIQLNATTAGGGIDMNAGSGGVTVDTTAAISLDSATASNFTVTGAADLTVNSTAGALNLTSGEANADSINITSAGGVNFVATGAAAKDTIITNTNGSMTLTAGESVTDAMNFTASGAASRVNITAGTGSIRLISGLIVPVVTKTTANTPYTVLGTDYFISCDTSGGVLTVTLPDAAALAGRTFVIRDTAGSAAVNNITIATAGGNLIGGGAAAATKVLSAAYSGATVYSNGVTWNYCYVA